MSKKSLLKSLRAADIRLLATLSAICIVALIGAWVATDRFREHVIDMDVHAQSTHWKDHFPTGIENLEGALKGEPLTEKDKQWLDFTVRMSGIFRYKFYSADGVIVHASRPKDLGKKTKRDYFFNIVAKGRIFTKVAQKPMAEVKKDRALLGLHGKMSMGTVPHAAEFAATAAPKTHTDKTGAARGSAHDNATALGAIGPVRTVSEIYVPYMKDGRFLGTVEVYLDSTAAFAGYESLTDNLRYGILIFCLFIFLSAGFFIMQNVRERERNFQTVLDAEAKIQRKNRLESLGSMMSSISQEMRNPVGALRSTAFLIAEKTKGKKLGLEKPLGRIERATGRLETIVSDLLDFTRAAEPQMKAVALDDCVKAVSGAMKLPETIKITKDLQMGRAKVTADPEQLRRVLFNLIANAADAVTDKTGGLSKDSPTPEIKVHTAKTAERVEISVTDNGPGITPSDLARIFEPLFTTKTMAVGLGLPAAMEIMQQHGGGIEVTSEQGKGTTATAWLPLDSLVEKKKRTKKTA